MSKLYLHYEGEGSKGAPYTAKMDGVTGKTDLEVITSRFVEMYNEREPSSSSAAGAKLEPACMELRDMDGYPLAKLGQTLEACQIDAGKS